MPESAMPKPSVLVYAEPLLARSMTFIRTQAEALRAFRPYYISPHQHKGGLPLPKERVVVMRQGHGRLSLLSEIPFKMWGYAPFYTRRLNALRPVLFHAHFGPAALRALPLARALKIPMIATFQGYDATMYDEFGRISSHYAHRVYIRKRKILEEGAALFIAVSHFIRGEMIRQGFSARKIVVHYVGVDTALFRPDPSVKREPIILFTGRLAEKKGCEYLIRAVAKLRSDQSAPELIIIGDGTLRKDLERLAAQNLSRYRFLGFQPPEVVRHWMNRARVFGVPSLRAQSGDAEGYPNAFAEAQAMGLPIVSFDADGVREAVAHGKTGWLAKERDIDSLTCYLQKMVDDPGLCARMGAAAREYVMEHFNLHVQTRKLEDLYFRVLEKENLDLGQSRAGRAFEDQIATLGS